MTIFETMDKNSCTPNFVENLNEGTDFIKVPIRFKVVGQWSSWKPITDCNSTCQGSRMVQRVCDPIKPLQENERQDCGSDQLKQSRLEGCNSDIACPIHGNWAKWGPWSGKYSF